MFSRRGWSKFGRRAQAMVAALLAASRRSTVRVDDEFCDVILSMVEPDTLSAARALADNWPPHQVQTTVSERAAESQEAVASFARELAKQLKELSNAQK